MMAPLSHSKEAEAESCLPIPALGSQCVYGSGPNSAFYMEKWLTVSRGLGDSSIRGLEFDTQNPR